ncbi:MAG: hypothetical protein GY710_16645 [Desulfobacteraceae bacterium]|nr:hypothetical protein [Desulfobacteraceae bacterium]
MPASLATNWKRIAQSGPTVDGREIKPEWLTQMAESYDPKVYTAKIWIDHMRYASYGSVKALKAEQDGDVVRLFAKISPSRSLLQMNQVWEEYLHFSIEPMENFAKTGKCYLMGLAMTDSPASLGTEEMRFSQATGRTFSARYPGEKVPDLREMGNEDQQVENFMEKLGRMLFQTNKNDQDKQGEEPMDKVQFKELTDSLNLYHQKVDDLATKVEKFMAGDDTGAKDGNVTNEPETATDKAAPAQDQFTTLETKVDDLAGKFDTLLGRMEKTAPGTTFGDTTQGADDKDELL